MDLTSESESKMG